MEITIKTKNIELTPHLEEYINDKVGKLEKFVGSANQAVMVEVEKESKHHRKGDVFCASIQVTVPGKTMMAKANGPDLLAAVIEAKDEMEIEIKKHKTKMVDGPRRKVRKEMGQELA